MTLHLRGQADRTLVVERTFDAPRDLVFEAWTDPKRARAWWGPKGFEVTHLELDARPGGQWRKCMRSPEGREAWRSGVFREIVRPERLVFTYFSDDPNSTRGHETVVTVTLRDEGGKTRMVLHQTLFESKAARDAHQRGWTSTIERLGNYLASDARSGAGG